MFPAGSDTPQKVLKISALKNILTLNVARVISGEMAGPHSNELNDLREQDRRGVFASCQSFLN